MDRMERSDRPIFSRRQKDNAVNAELVMSDYRQSCYNLEDAVYRLKRINSDDIDMIAEISAVYNRLDAMKTLLSGMYADIYRLTRMANPTDHDDGDPCDEGRRMPEEDDLE